MTGRAERQDRHASRTIRRPGPTDHRGAAARSAGRDGPRLLSAPDQGGDPVDHDRPDPLRHLVAHALEDLIRRSAAVWAHAG